MKELSIEEKAKRYDEALERAKAMIKVAANQDEAIGFANTIFPELAESENERIRKAIHIYLDWLDGRNKDCQPKGEYTIRDMIAWLEKQGEQILANSAKTCKDEQKSADEEMKTLLRTEYEKGRADAIAEMQKPAWSEEDERIFEQILQQFMTANNDCKLHNASFTYDKEISFLKSLKERVQPKEELSEENARLLDNCISLIEDIPYTEDEQNWLKSLRPQNRWKPSEEQMKSLDDALSLAKNCGEENAFDLRTLYEQLKKLKEE